MSTRPRALGAALRSQFPPPLADREALVLPIERTAPSILDAVRDQHDTLWIRYGTRQRAVWLPVADFARPEGVATLINLDPRLIEPVAQRKLRSAVAQTRTFRPARVSASPGWLGHSFVLGDGSVISPSDGASEIIVTFPGHPKFTPVGTLEDWQNALDPVAPRQSFVLFALSLAFVGPLLPFVPPDYLSPLFEIVGAPGTGKSTLGVVAASIWAGDRENGSGGGETWNLTPGRFDEVKLSHRQTLLLLDEANLAGATLNARRQLIQHAVFGLTSTSPRQRLGDPPSKPNAQLAVLSTSNRRLSELIEGSADERGAVHERMITIPVAETRSYGVLDTIPAGFASAAPAVEALRSTAQGQWGTAGPAFVRKLQGNVVRDENRLRAQIARGLAQERQRLSAITDLPRVQKSLALVSVAGRLAGRWDILPTSWGCPVSAVRSVAEEAFSEKAGQSDFYKLINTYLEQHRADIIEVSSLNHPLTRPEFEAAIGFLRRSSSGNELMIPAEIFRAAFPDHERIMRALRASGHAQTEGGEKPKLTIKTPKAVCDSGRVYCIYLSI